MTNENAKGCGLTRGFEKLGVRVKKLWGWIKKYEVVFWLILSIIIVGLYFWDYHQLYWITEDLDVGEFKDVILVIVAFFVPFAIVFYTDLATKSENRSEFEKMVFSEKVMSTKKIFWALTLSVSFFAFCAGDQENSLMKVLSIALLAGCIRFFYGAFQRILKYSEGNKHEFEIDFLKSLKLSKWWTQKNKNVSKKINTSWRDIWAAKSDRYENELTSVFIEHVDGAIETGHYDLASGLMEKYEMHIDKRRLQIVLEKILPNVLLWCGLTSANVNKPIYLDCARFFKGICTLTITDEYDASNLQIFFNALENYMTDPKNQKTNFYKAPHSHNGFFSILCQMLFNSKNFRDIWTVYCENENVPRHWSINSDNVDNIPHKFILREIAKWATSDQMKKNQGWEKAWYSVIPIVICKIVDDVLDGISIPEILSPNTPSTEVEKSLRDKITENTETQTT
jgi:hypothetical protein